MNAVDFSCKHHILIRHKDGTLTPMDEPYYEPEQLDEKTWRIMSSGDWHYLVVGEDEAIAIDTGYGAGNLREYLESLCGKPVRRVINTHHHFDHSANNCYFDLAYMAEESVELAAIPYPSFSGIEFPRDYAVQVVGDDDIIPLKGRPLRIFKIGDHTDGGIAILDPTHRMLFTGDEIMDGGKMISKTVEKLARDMEKLMAHRHEFDICYGGPGINPAETVDIFYEAAQKILAGEESPEEDKGHRMPPRHEPPKDGQIIYDCQMPHPEDVGGGNKKPRAGTGEIKTFVHRGWRFMYHADNVR